MVKQSEVRDAGASPRCNRYKRDGPYASIETTLAKTEKPAALHCTAPHCTALHCVALSLERREFATANNFTKVPEGQ